MGQHVCGFCTKQSSENGEVLIGGGSIVSRNSSRRSSVRAGINISHVHTSLDTLKAEFLSLYEEDIEGPGYETMLDKGGILVTNKKIGDEYIMKYRFYIPFSPEQFFTFLNDTENRANWDKNVFSASIVAQESQLKIVRTIYKKYMVISSREALLATKRYRTKGKIFEVTQSVKSPAYPEQEDPVRITMRIGGFLAEGMVPDVNGNMTKVTGISQIDFKLAQTVSNLFRKISSTAIPGYTSSLLRGMKNYKNLTSS